VGFAADDGAFWKPKRRKGGSEGAWPEKRRYRLSVGLGYCGSWQAAMRKAWPGAWDLRPDNAFGISDNATPATPFGPKRSY